MTSTELSELVAAQRAFFLTGKTRDKNFRKERLQSLKNTLLKYESEILAALAKDLHKSPEEAYTTELGIVLKEINFLRRGITRWTWPKFHLTSPANFPGISKTLYEPYGCALLLTPWNFPIQIPLMAVAAAISAGNCVVLKPSHHAPACGQLLQAILQEAFPPELVRVVTGGNEIHHPLLTQKFDFIFYTGGASAGKKVMEAAARNLTPVCLELGGKNPCIVDSTADIDSAAKRIIWGKLLNSGQNCVAPDYVLVQKDRHEELIEKMCGYIEEFYGENPVASESKLASVISERHFFRLLNLANGNNPANGTVVTPNPSGAAYNKATLKIKPVLLDSPEPNAPVMQDEILGPILPIIPYDTLDEAISLIQSKPEPLALYLFTTDKVARQTVTQTLRYGGGCINDAIVQAASSHLPLGGTGASGMGSYHGKAGFVTFSHEKAMLSKPAKLDFPFRYSPYKKSAINLVKMILK